MRIFSKLVWLCCLLPAVGNAAPYEDVKQRFRLDLPEGWSWTPQPGDTFGEWFRKNDTGAIGNFGVRVIKLKTSQTLLGFAKQTEEGIRNEPGYRQLGEVPSMIGMHQSIKRDYVMFVAGSDRIQRRVQEQFFINGDYGYWLHFETLAEGFDLFQRDLDHMLASFVAIAGGQRAHTAGGKAERAMGHWKKTDDNLFFDLRLDGSFSLGDNTGTFVIDNSHLVLTIPGKAQEAFNYSFIANEMIVSGPYLEEPIHYMRVPGPKAVLSGFWRAHQGTETLRLSPGGSFIFGEHTGGYQVKGDLIVLKRKDGAELTYVFLLDGDLLKLSGGDLVEEALFDRVK